MENNASQSQNQVIRDSDPYNYPSSLKDEDILQQSPSDQNVYDYRIDANSMIDVGIDKVFSSSEVGSEQNISSSYQDNANNLNNILGVSKIRLDHSLVNSSHIPLNLDRDNKTEKILLSSHQKKKSVYKKTNQAAASNNQFQEYENVYKIIMIGSSFAGKTSLLFRFVNDSFDRGYLNTVGVDLKTVTLKIFDTLARVNIWDTTGQEKFKSLTKSYFRNCQGAVAVFDLTKRDSFYSIESSIKEFRLNCPTESKDNIVLVGNKVDLSDQRQVSQDEAQQLVSRLGLLGYFEASASTNQNVDQLFFTVAHKAYHIEKEQAKINVSNKNIVLGQDQNGIRGRTSTSIQLEQYDTHTKKKRSGCC